MTSKRSEDNQSQMIFNMERKLNATWFAKRFNKKDKYCALSTNEYWDWLTYIDVNYQITHLLL